MLIVSWDDNHRFSRRMPLESRVAKLVQFVRFRVVFRCPAFVFEQQHVFGREARISSFRPTS